MNKFSKRQHLRRLRRFFVKDAQLLRFPGKRQQRACRKPLREGNGLWAAVRLKDEEHRLN